MDVPAEEEGGVATESNGSNESVPIRTQPKLHQRNQLEDECQKESMLLGHLGKDGEGGIPNKASGDTIEGLPVHRQTKTRSHYSKVRYDNKAALGTLQNSRGIKARSMNEYIAQKFGAQYA